jgi:haloalkane dehalogenase
LGLNKDGLLMIRREAIKLCVGALATSLAGGESRRALSQGVRSPQEFQAARRYIKTVNGRIAYIEQGAGPAAFFLHGWPLNGYHWRGSMARLSQLRRCIAVDFMGLGYTQVAANTDLSPLSQAEMIISVMDALKVDRADLISNDSGTTIAQLLAAYHPERVRSMLITNGDVHTNSPPPMLQPTIQEAREGTLIERLDKQVRDPLIAQTSEGLGVVYTHPTFVTPELVEIYLGPLVASPVRRRQCQAYGVAFEPNPLPAIEHKLKHLRIPARILWGTGDPLFTREWAEWLDKTIPTSQGVRYVEGAKLFFTEEFPEIVMEEARHLWSVGASQ